MRTWKVRHTQREREREYGVVWYNSLSTTTTTTTREREREISSTLRRVELDRGPPPAPPALGSPSFLADGLGKDPIPHSVLRIKSNRVY